MAKLFLGQNDAPKKTNADKKKQEELDLESGSIFDIMDLENSKAAQEENDDMPNHVGRTHTIKERISEIKGRVIILDFSNEYRDVTDNVFLLDEINLFDSLLNYREMQAINAGYIHNSHILYKNCIDLIKETEDYKALKEKYNGNIEADGFQEELYQIQTPNLIDDTLLRLYISWDPVQSAYSKILNDTIPKKRSKDHIPLEAAVHKVLDQRVVRIQAKTMKSEHQRAVAFCLLTRLSHMLDEPFTVVGDNISSFFNDGNTKLFLEAINQKNIDFIYGFNKPSVLPKAIMPTISTVYFHKIDNKAEIKELMKVFGLEDTHEIVQSVPKLKKNQYLIYSHAGQNELIKKS